MGTVLTRDELIGIARFCERRNLILLSDEIYEAITYGDCRAYLAARDRAASCAIDAC